MWNRFEEEHQVIGQQLAEIERELESVIEREGSWRQAVPAFRRLLVLLETEVGHHVDAEEHDVMSRLAQLPGARALALARCSQEVQCIRLQAEQLRHDLSLAFSGRPPPERDLFIRGAQIIELVRANLAHDSIARAA
jgi:hypothetical protein